jgi:hypothetical protein
MSKTMKTVKRMPVVQEAAEQIYLAGLGAFALAEEEGNKHTFGRITAPFDAGVTTALHRLGVPTRKEIGLLTKRVEELTKSVEKTRHTRRAAPARRAKRAMAK